MHAAIDALCTALTQAELRRNEARCRQREIEEKIEALQRDLKSSPYHIDRAEKNVSDILKAIKDLGGDPGKYDPIGKIHSRY